MTVKKFVILASSSAQAEQLERVLKEPTFEGYDVSIEIANGLAAATAVPRAASTRPGVALAMICSTEADALVAITAGADEALVLSSIDSRGVELLLERTAVRATMRLTHASATGDAAHAEKLAALGTVVAGVAHEINNPLASVMLSVDALKLIVAPLITANEELQRRAMAHRAILPDEVARLAAQSRNGADLGETRAMLDDMEAQVHTIAEIVRDLRIYARSDENEAPQIVDVPGLIDQVLRIVGPQIAARGHIERDYAPELPLLALPRSRVVQVLTNILVNAAQAIAELDRPVHRVRVTARADAEFVAVSVSDTGPGIAPEVLERIFDPFFTTKEVGAGTGLGLAISQSILRRLGGDLIAESVHGEGATFIALLPVPDAASIAKAKTAGRRSKNQDRHALVSRPTVLVVEDDDRLLRAYPRTLHGHYDVIVAADGQEAIDLLLSGSHADAILTDLAMPEVDGQQLFEWLTDHRPDLARKTIFVTAGARSDRSADFLHQMNEQMILEKPVTREQLLAALERVLR